MKTHLLITQLAVCLALAPANASADEMTELKHQVELMRQHYEQQKQSIEQMQHSYEKQIQALEKRLERAENTAAATKPAPSAATPGGSALDQAVAEAAKTKPPIPTQAPTPTLALSSGNIGPSGSLLRLIDISFDIMTAAGWSTAPNSTIELLEGGGHDPKRRGFTLQQGELGLSGAVDPYLMGEAYVIFQEDVVELEEAYLKTLSLPYSLQAKAGYFLTEFGRNNPTHPHAWHWIDQPVVNTRLLGPEGLRGVGARLSWLVPTPWYSDLSFGVQNSTSETAASFLGEPPGPEYGQIIDVEEGVAFGKGIGGYARVYDDIKSLSDMLYMVRWANAGRFSPTWDAQIGLSALYGPNTTGSPAETWIFGGDLVAKWRPVNSFRGWPFFILETEVMGRNYKVNPSNPAFIAGETSGTLHDWGLYTQGLYGFYPRWAAGLRSEYVGGSGSGPEPRSSDPFRSDRYRISPLLLFQPTEFSRLRLQYNYDYADWLAGKDDHSVWFGVEVSYGEHPAHRY